VDFADIKAIMANAGSALMGIGSAIGERRAEKAAFQAANSPLLELSIMGAKGVLFAVSGGEDLALHEIQEIAKVITESTDKDAKVIFGAIHDPRLKKGEVKVTVIATGFPTDAPKKTLFQSQAQSNFLKEEAQPQKKEINNTGVTEYVKKVEKKTDIIDDFENQPEDWSAVPAFLRRNKK
jgi:cell division protein FtsZ